ncbi:MAG TPA: septum formation initiator family protein [Clostridiales bacterium]|jgi:cell division protein FtsL|nr:septum formation initiator family protein [Clostridiales bacterium]
MKKDTTAKAAKKKHKQADRIQPSKKRWLLILICGLLFLVIAVSGYRLIALKIEARQAQTELERLTQERERLKKELKSIDSDGYIEKKAREELKMILPDEMLYVIVESEDKAGGQSGQEDKSNGQATEN